MTTFEEKINPTGVANWIMNDEKTIGVQNRKVQRSEKLSTKGPARDKICKCLEEYKTTSRLDFYVIFIENQGEEMFTMISRSLNQKHKPLLAHGKLLNSPLVKLCGEIKYHQSTLPS